MKVARVAVNYPQKNSGLLYFYEGEVFRGQVVRVPLGKREELGCVVSVDESSSKEFLETPKEKIKNIIELVLEMQLDERELSIFEWMSAYYHYSLGQLIFDCLPHILKRPREIEVINGEGKELEFIPNEIQGEISKKILQGKNYFNKYLIHGVTGSGKTVVFLNIIREILKEGKSVLYLLPEINLTPQFISTFSKYISTPIVSFHSELSDSQKFQIWQKCKDAKEPIFILGVRSSVFIPINNLGLIIVDEEHDSSFKQDDRCPYNARDVAIKKAQTYNIPVVLGSATPSLETYFGYHYPNRSNNLFEMRNRAANAFLPKIELLDARDKENGKENNWPLTPGSVEAIGSALKKKEQVLVFVNRLGYANYLQCRSCGKQFFCPNCTIAMRFFKKKNQLACNHCDYHETVPSQCPDCGCLTLSQKGFGTEKVQEVVQSLFPEKRIERFDRDEIKNFKELEKRLNDFHSGKIDLLVGTQMLSKGHNFEKVKLVLVLGIDSQLNFPDFRSSERVYQTLTQVSGRAGRYSQDGKVIIQTLNPENMIFKQIQEHSFLEFYEEELKVREICDCPPFKRIALLHFSSRFQDRLVEHVNNSVGTILRDLIRKHFPEVIILGPRPATIEKKLNQFTWSVLLKSSNINQLHNLIKTFELNYERVSSISYKIDIDPYTVI